MGVHPYIASMHSPNRIRRRHIKSHRDRPVESIAARIGPMGGPQMKHKLYRLCASQNYYPNRIGLLIESPHCSLSNAASGAPIGAVERPGSSRIADSHPFRWFSPLQSSCEMTKSFSRGRLPGGFSASSGVFDTRRSMEK